MQLQLNLNSNLALSVHQRRGRLAGFIERSASTMAADHSHHWLQSWQRTLNLNRSDTCSNQLPAESQTSNTSPVARFIVPSQPLSATRPPSHALTKHSHARALS